mmetsp:Transcript_4056/g.15652  ORF Transcript_4056/g.15652 Transcript_4056/m.15652 type:complete len:793 (-) Transcript_4056:1768-4146(-)
MAGRGIKAKADLLGKEVFGPSRSFFQVLRRPGPWLPRALERLLKLRTSQQLRRHWEKVLWQLSKLGNSSIRYHYHPVGWLYGQALSDSDVPRPPEILGGRDPNDRNYQLPYGEQAWKAAAIHADHGLVQEATIVDRVRRERDSDDPPALADLGSEDLENLFGDLAVPKEEKRNELEELARLFGGPGGETSLETVLGGRPDKSQDEEEMLDLDDPSSRQRKTLYQAAKFLVSQQFGDGEVEDRVEAKTLETGERAFVVHNRVAPVYGANDALAYTAFTSMANFATTQRVFEEMAFMMGPRALEVGPGAIPLSWWDDALHDEPKRVLDFGAGSGLATAAALAPPSEKDPGVWDREPRCETDDVDTVVPLASPTGDLSWPLRGPIRARCVDHSATMRDMTRTVLDQLLKAQEAAKAAHGDGPPETDARRPSFPELQEFEVLEDLASASAGDKQDVVLCTYTLSELPSDKVRAAVTSVLWNCLAPEGCLVVVERGTAFGSHVVRSARQFVLDNSGGYATVVAPCTHDRPCPMPQGSFCSFRQPAPYAPRETAALSDAKRRGSARGFAREPFSYVVLRKVATDAVGSASDDQVARDRGEPVISTVGAQALRSWIGDALDSPLEGQQHPPPLLRLTRPAYLDVAMRAAGGDRGAFELLARLRQLHPTVEADDAEGDGAGDEAEPAATSEEGAEGELDSAAGRHGYAHRTEGLLHMAVCRDEWARIVRGPQKRKGHTVLALCTPTGKLKSMTVGKARGDALLPGGYAALRKAERGGLWPFPREHVDVSRVSALLDKMTG